MTDNKRFKQLTEKGFTHAFLDTKNLNISYICDNSNDCKNIVILLNDLNEEKEQLKQELARQQLINTSMKTEKGIDKLQSKIKELIDENEKLKFELNKLSRENRRFEIFIQRLHDIAEENGALSKCRVKAEIQYFREQC